MESESCVIDVCHIESFKISFSVGKFEQEIHYMLCKGFYGDFIP